SIVSNAQGGILVQAEPDDSGDSDSNDSGSTGVLAGSSGDFEGDGGLRFDARQAGPGTPSLYLENCFVSGGTDTDAVAVFAGAAELLYSTLAGFSTISGQSRALYCEQPSNVIARNSLFVA